MPTCDLETTIVLPELNYIRFRLENGLTVLVHEDNKAPVVGMTLWYHVGSANEPKGKTGFAHLFEHLMFSGSEHHRGSYFEPFAHVGATDLNGTTWFDRTNYFVTVPTTALDMAMWMESDRMGHLLGAIGQAEFDAQRGVVKNEKRQNQNPPFGRVDETIQNAVYPADHPYHHITIGSMEDIDAASLEGVQHWFRTHYGAANATLVLAGDITPAVAREKAERFFGHVEPGPQQPRLQPWIAPLDRPVRDEMVDRVPNKRVYRRWNVPGLQHHDAPLLELGAIILGGGRASRLFGRLVHERAIASSISAWMRAFALAGQFSINVDVVQGIDPAEVEIAIDEELARFRNDGPTHEELEGARNDLLAGFLRSLEKVGGMEGKAAVLAEGQVLRGDPHARLRDLQIAATATPEDVRAAVERWILGAHYTLVVAPPTEEQDGSRATMGVRSISGDRPEPRLLSSETFRAGESVVDRQAGAPAVTNYPDVSFPGVERRRLGNGIEVTFAERRGSGIVEIRLLSGEGGMLDVGQAPGLNGFMSAMVNEGTETLDARAIEARRQWLGARLSGSALGSLVSELGPSLDLLAEMVRYPAFREEDIARLKPRWLAQIARQRTDPNSIARTVMLGELFGRAHPYGVPGAQGGTAESIGAIDRRALVAFHQAVNRPDRLRIFASGDVDLDQLLLFLEASFGDWSAPDVPPVSAAVPQAARPAAPRLVMVDRPGADQSFILGGIVATVAGEFPLPQRIANGVFGGQFSSRLNMNLREDKHWAYGAYSSITSDVVQGRMTMNASVQTDSTAEALREMMAEVEAISAERPPAAAEIARVKAQEIRTLPGQYETVSSVVDALYANAVLKRPDDHVPMFRRRIEVVTDRDVQEAVGDLFVPDAMTWVVVGDLAQTESSLRGLGLEIRAVNVDGEPVDGHAAA